MEVIVHYPTSEAGKRALADRVATVHADAVIRYIKGLDCPKEQKIELVNAIVETEKQKAE